MEDIVCIDANQEILTPSRAHIPCLPYISWFDKDTPQKKINLDTNLMKQIFQVQDQHHVGKRSTTNGEHTNPSQNACGSQVTERVLWHSWVKNSQRMVECKEVKSIYYTPLGSLL